MKPVMSADSSWMMSGAVPPWNWVTSWSCTESQLPWTYSTWMFGLAAFQSATIFLVAATVVFWKARLWNFSRHLLGRRPRVTGAVVTVAPTGRERHQCTRRHQGGYCFLHCISSGISNP
jgi:hypothetical protein